MRNRTVAFLIPTEIFPSQLRAQGNGFGVTGWAIGVGMTVLVNPIMFNVLQNRTYFLFGGLNLLWDPDCLPLLSGNCQSLARIHRGALLCAQLTQ